MKRTVTKPNNDVLDRLLEQHLAGCSAQLAPSSGFVASVMESIQADAAEPPPIAFPWRRVLPGGLAALCGLIVLVVMVLHGSNAAPAASAPASVALHFAPALTAGNGVVLWILVAACLSVAAIAASFRLAGRSR